LGFKETINAVPFYNPVAEESEVVDFSSLNRRVYSTQLFSSKDNLLERTPLQTSGWKTFVPRKAIQDPRTFQSFNWRIVAKINYNFSQVRNIYSEEQKPTVRVAVIKTREEQIAKYPYVFYNMETGKSTEWSDWETAPYVKADDYKEWIEPEETQNDGN
jgi:hypothetical protein